jgi:hypothetical protein
MREDCNPSRRRGERNVFCSNYNHCLDLAIDRSWDFWNCTKCSSRYNQGAGMKNMDISREFVTFYECNIPSMSFDWIPSDGEINGDFDTASL